MDPSALWRSKAIHYDIAVEGTQGKINYQTLQGNGQDLGQLEKLIRFGDLATRIAIGRGQSERLHLDLFDDDQTYTIIMCIGSPDVPWNRSEGQGVLCLPTLGVTIPMNMGDVIYFQASVLPHYVIKLDDKDRDKRLVVTMFTCRKLTQYLSHPPCLVRGVGLP